jgi:hypothetical protein
VIAVVLALIFSLSPRADTYTAVPFSEILQRAQSPAFSFREKGRLFGYYSTDSCLWTSCDLVIVEHYCDSGQTDRARSLTLWSRDFGMVHLYEEEYGGVRKRDIEITQFPEALAPYLPADMNAFSVETMNGILEKLYQQPFPSCWSSSFDPYSLKPDADCYLVEPSLYSPWIQETQGIVNDEGRWNSAYDQLLRKVHAAFFQTPSAYRSPIR